MIFKTVWTVTAISQCFYIGHAHVLRRREINDTNSDMPPAGNSTRRPPRENNIDSDSGAMPEDFNISTAPVSTAAGVEKSHTWSYDSDGPAHWPAECRSGRRQSPIDIDTRRVVRVDVPPMRFHNYDRVFEGIRAENNGHSIVFTGFDRNPNTTPYIEGGGLHGRYMLQQFHFHWSHRFSNGSEHTINRHHYPVEVHMVHAREGQELAEALADSDHETVAVLAVLGMIGEDGVAFEGIARKFPDFPGDRLTVSFRPSLLLPSDTSDFFNYDGSLTTPSCAETVTWILFHEPISITVEQLSALRLVNFADRADADTRPVQPINGRRVFSCHASGDAK